MQFTTSPIFALAALVASVSAASCGGSGSFQVNNVVENFGDTTIGPHVALRTTQGTAQICIANRSPNTAVTITGGQINGAISAILNSCCSNVTFCSGGGQEQVTGPNGNVIDVSVQASGQDCTAF